MRLKIREKLRAASLSSKFTDSYKKRGTKHFIKDQPRL